MIWVKVDACLLLKNLHFPFQNPFHVFKELSLIYYFKQRALLKNFPMSLALIIFLVSLSFPLSSSTLNLNAYKLR